MLLNFYSKMRYYFWLFLSKTPLYRLTLISFQKESIRSPHLDIWNMPHGEKLLNGHFAHAGIIYECNENHFWDLLTSNSHLEKYLHSFEWFKGLGAVGTDDARRLARKIVSQWIKLFPYKNNIPWKLNSIGPRLRAWTGLYNFFVSTAENEFHDAFLVSLIAQKKHLQRFIDSLPEGADLLLCLEGLLYAQCLLDEKENGAEKTALKIEKLISVLLDFSLYPDSRGPEFILTAARLLIDVRSILRIIGIPCPLGIQNGIQKLLPIVRFLRQQDGMMPFIHKSSSPSIETLLMHLDTQIKFMPKSLYGYERLQGHNTVLVLDIYGHGHLLSPEKMDGPFCFSLASGEDRIIDYVSSIQINNSDFDSEQHYNTPHFERTEEDMHFWCEGRVMLRNKGHAFIHTRKLYLTNSDLRGEDIVWGHESMPFQQFFVLTTKLNRINNNCYICSTQSGSSWMFQIEGHSKLIHEGNRLIVMGHTSTSDQEDDPEYKMIKWAFQKVSL